jgi:hypothetical protein
MPQIGQIPIKAAAFTKKRLKIQSTTGKHHARSRNAVTTAIPELIIAVLDSNNEEVRLRMSQRDRVRTQLRWRMRCSDIRCETATAGPLDRR